MTVVCIAGMHRSGTSMVARLLNLSGLYLGPDEDCWDPRGDNPDGFWENRHFVKINDQILREYQGAWDVVPSKIPTQWDDESKLLPYRLMANELVDQFKGWKHWGWKDPRNSLTAGFWNNFLPNLKVVVCLRNPLEVSQSLNRRGYSSNSFSFRLWQAYNECLISSIPGEKRIVTHFDSFFVNPRAELMRLLSFLNISPSNDQIENALNSINIRSRHDSVSMVDLIEQADSYELVDLYQALCKQAGPNYEVAAGGIVTYSRKDFYAHKSNVSLKPYKYSSKVKHIIRNLEIEITDKTQKIKEEAQIRENQERSIKDLNYQLNEQQLLVSSLNQTIHLLNKELGEIKRGVSWKFYLLVVRLRLFILPTGSWRERSSIALVTKVRNLRITLKGIWNFLTNIYYIQRNDGIAGLWTRVINKLKTVLYKKQPSTLSVNEVYADLLSSTLEKKSDLYVPISNEGTIKETSVKLIAFYLPQYHPIPENDEWWGKGFTEWTNVSKAIPQFVGHYQPRLPGELGFYDLRVPEVQYRQIELARQYGISGFCFYYYWFQGKRLLERPLDQFINDSKIDFPFCICWANENWSRRWDGQENDILIGQNHSIESDLQFIHDVAPLFKNKNYIRINDRPILIVYRANILPDPAGTAKRWKEYCKSIGLAEPYLIAAQTFYFEDPREIDFDAAIQFPPHSKSQVSINDKLKILNPQYKGNVIDYANAWPIFADLTKKVSYKIFRTVFPSWDNEARKPGNGYTFAFSSPKEYQRWLEAVMKFTMEEHAPAERLVFINAWNEWAEGAYLEPDRQFGYAYLQATRDALRNVHHMIKRK